jgi:hypothetical protein
MTEAKRANHAKIALESSNRTDSFIFVSRPYS